MKINVRILKAMRCICDTGHNKSANAAVCSIAAFLVVVAAALFLREDNHEAAEDVNKVDE